MGLDPRRVAQIIRASPVQGSSWRGSGYLLDPSTVLTAAHVVAGVSTARVRLDAGGQADRTLEGRCEALGDDLALIRLSSPDVVLPSARPPSLGHLGSRPLLVDAVAAGFPLFRLVTAAPGEEMDASAKPFRDFAQVPGEIAALDGRRSGTITFHVDVRFAPYREVPSGRSPWEGMSGAALWVKAPGSTHHGCLVAVISQDPDPDRPVRLIAVRLEAAVRDAMSTAETTALSEGLFGAPFVDATADARGQAVLLDHRRQALRRIHDAAVVGRGEELARMQEFCAGEGTLLVWCGQEWAGKTALMSAFVAEPPGNVDVVSFFVNDRSTTERDLSGFLASMGRQLEAVLDSPQGSRLESPGALEGAFWRLAEDAAAASEDRGRRLVILVDGLDEDAALGAGARLRSIAAVFSGPVPSHLRVILATRPYRRVLAEIGHKTDLNRHDLSPSPLAGESEAQARADIEDALGEDGLALEVLGLLTAARSGLAHTELANLMRQLPGVVLPVLQTSLRNCVHSIEIREGDLSSRTVYEFPHASLPDIVGDDEHLGRDGVHGYVERIHTWATESTSRGWGDVVPDFLALGYPKMLIETADPPRLLEYALDPDRQEWLRERLGNDLAAVSQLGQAERLNRAAGRPDLGTAVRLAKSRDALRDRSSSLSSAALTVLAATNWRKAAALAHGAGDGSVAVVAGHLVETAQEDLGPASAVTHLIKAPSYAAPAFCQLALAQHARGQPAPAEETAALALAEARKVDDLPARVTCLTQVAAALTTIGHPSVAGEALAHAAEAAHQIVDDRSRVACLMRLAAPLASGQGPGSALTVVDEALAIARGVDDPARAAALLTVIASSDGGGLIGHDDRADLLLEARRAAESIQSANERARTLAAVSLAQVHAGVPYESSLEEAIELATHEDYPKFHAEILEACATVLASAGKRERAASLLEEAVTVAAVYSLRYDEYTWWRRADTLNSLARTQARQGLHQAARDTVTTHLEQEQQLTLASLADVQIDADEPDEAAATIQLISNPDYHIRASGKLACTLARNKDPSAASRLDEFVGKLERLEAEHKASNDLWYALGYAALAAHYLGRAERALELAEMSLAAAERSRDPLERVEVLLGVGRAYAAAGNRERATQHLQQAMRIAEGLDAGDEPNLKSRYDEAIIAVAVAQAAIGQYSHALAAIAQLKRSAWPAWREKAKAYIAIASIQVKSGQTTDADATFSLAVATALQEYEPLEAHRSNNMLESIALEQARAGRQSAAWATVEELREQELKYWHSNYADRCLAKIAEYYASASLNDAARKTTERIRDADIRSEIEQRLSNGTKTSSAGAASSAGQADEPDGWESRARQMLDQLESEGFAYDPGSRSDQTLLELAETARVHGSHRLAVKLVAAAFATLPCHKVLEAACRVEPSLGTLLEELEPW
jgi:Trypsin-like peptidase domain